MSPVFQGVPTRACCVSGAPKPPGPAVHAPSSNEGWNQVADGSLVVYRQSCGVRSDAGTTCWIAGGVSYRRRFAATDSGESLVTARSYVMTPLTSISTSVVCV